MTTALDNLLKAVKAVARHEQAYRQCARTERWPITMPVGELFDLSDAVAAVEAAPAVHSLMEVLEQLEQKAEAFRAATIENGILIRSAQNLYIDELRALEGAIADARHAISATALTTA